MRERWTERTRTFSRRLWPSLAAAVLSLLASSAAQALQMTLNPGSLDTLLGVNVLNTSGATTFDLLSPETLPYQDSHTVIDVQAAATSFEVTFELARGADGRTEAHGSILFGVDELASYAISGFFSMSGPVAHLMDLEISLRDVTANSHLFQDRQISENTPDETFVAGASGGDSFNQVSGKISGGVLNPGREYQFVYRFNDRRKSGAPLLGPFEGGGEVVFALLAVPEPSSGSLLGLGLTLLVVHWRRAATARC